MGLIGSLNDLWRYSNSEWTWMAGGYSVEVYGSYGIMGVASPSNYPGSRYGPVSWIDSAGSFWLFGGIGGN